MSDNPKPDKPKKSFFKKIGGAVKKAAGQVLEGLGNAIGQAKWGGD